MPARLPAGLRRAILPPGAQSTPSPGNRVRIAMLARRTAPFLFAIALSTALAAQTKYDAAAKRASHERMVRTLASLAERAKSDHKYHGDAAAKALWAELTQLGAKAGWNLRLDAALAHLRLGATRDGIAVLEQAWQALDQRTIDGDEDAKNAIRFYLGMAWLRQAETDNCCARNAP